MRKGGEVHLQLDHVLVKVKERNEEYLKAVALQIQAETKLKIQQNGQIDVGFMINSVYTLSKRGDTYNEANASGQYKSGRTGKTVVRKLAPKQGLPSHALAATVVGAEYAIWQEEKKSFLYAAAEKVSNDVKGTAEKVYKEGLKE
jgi:hypothetical protein